MWNGAQAEGWRQGRYQEPAQNAYTTHEPHMKRYRDRGMKKFGTRRNGARALLSMSRMDTGIPAGRAPFSCTVTIAAVARIRWIRWRGLHGWEISSLGPPLACHWPSLPALPKYRSFLSAKTSNTPLCPYAAPRRVLHGSPASSFRLPTPPSPE
ncbi:hypothetical protein B0H14DRAFT_3136161 [Mycena olivaceomarginata]|nr:hypothetical protein B0H14DRAFT_3136161 [Mycena olivaceomarginata]